MGIAPPAAPPQNKGLRWWGWLLIICGGLLLFCSGFGAGAAATSIASSRTSTNSANNTNSPATTASSSPTSGATATPQGSAKQVKQVGDTITVDGVSCTLMSAQTVAGDDFAQPDTGNVFVLVTVKIVNSSSSEYDYNPFAFNAWWSTGNIVPESILGPSSVPMSQELGAGTLAAGGSVQGKILFQVPASDHQAKLTWQPTFLSDKTSNAWLLGI
jgi:hypothetical protein